MWFYIYFHCAYCRKRIWHSICSHRRFRWLGKRSCRNKMRLFNRITGKGHGFLLALRSVYRNFSRKVNMIYFLSDIFSQQGHKQFRVFTESCNRNLQKIVISNKTLCSKSGKISTPLPSRQEGSRFWQGKPQNVQYKLIIYFLFQC